MERSNSRGRSAGRQVGRTANAYDLRCNDCAYRTTVTGDLATVFEVVDDHERRRPDGGFDHFVDCELVDREPGDRGRDG